MSWKCVAGALSSKLSHPLLADLLSRRNLTSQFSSLSSNLSNTVSGIDIGSTSNKFTRGLSELQQSVKESIGRADDDAVTELPEGVAKFLVSTHFGALTVTPRPHARCRFSHISPQSTNYSNGDAMH